jgi:hypothetical protein
MYNMQAKNYVQLVRESAKWISIISLEICCAGFAIDARGGLIRFSGLLYEWGSDLRLGHLIYFFTAV